MANALERSGGRTAVAVGSGDPYARAGSDMGGSSAVYMKFNGNTGEFTAGADQDEIDAGTVLAAGMADFKRGWICWKEGEVVEEIMVRVTDGDPPPEHELTDHGPYIKTDDQNDGWQSQASLTFIDPDSGKEYTFKVTSKSALRSLGSLLKDFARQYKNHPGELPLVELGNTSFKAKNKSWGKKYAPVLKIVDWIAEDALGAAAAEAEEEEEAPPPKKATKPAAAKTEPKTLAAPKATKRPEPEPEPDPEPEDDEPAEEDEVPEGDEPEEEEDEAPEEEAPPPAEKPRPERGARRRSF